MYACKFCDKTYKTKERYDGHVKKHSTPTIPKEKELEYSRDTASVKSHDVLSISSLQSIDSKVNKERKIIAEQVLRLTNELKEQGQYIKTLEKQAQTAQAPAQRENSKKSEALIASLTQSAKQSQERVDQLEEELAELQEEGVSLTKTLHERSELVRERSVQIEKMKELIIVQERKNASARIEHERIISEYEEQIKKVCAEIASVRREKENNLSNFKREYEAIQAHYEAEVRREIQKVTHQLQESKKTHEEKVKETKELFGAELTRMQSEFESTRARECRAYEAKIEELNNELAVATTSAKESAERLKTAVSRTKEEVNKKYTEVIGNLNHAHAQELSRVALEYEAKFQALSATHASAGKVQQEEYNSLVNEINASANARVEAIAKESEQCKLSMELSYKKKEEGYSNKIGELTDTIDKLSAEIKHLHATIAKLKSNMNDINAQYVSNLDSVTQKCQEKLKESEERVSASMRTLEGMRVESIARLNQYEAELSETRNNISMIEDERSKLELKLKEKVDELAQSKTELFEMALSIRKVENELETTIFSTSKQIADLRESEALYKKRSETFHATVRDYEDMVNNTKYEIKRANDLLEAEKAKYIQEKTVLSNEHKKTVSHLKSTIADLEHHCLTEKDSTNSKIASVKSEYTEKITELTLALRTERLSVTTLSAEIDKLSREHTQRIAEILKEKKDELKKAENTILYKESDIRSLEEQIDTLQKKIVDMSVTHTKERTSLQEKATELINRSKFEYDRDTNKLKRDCERLMAEMNELKSNFKLAMNEQTNNNKQRIADLERDKVALELLIEKERSDYQHASEVEGKKAGVIIESLKKTIGELQTTIGSKNKEIQSVKDSLQAEYKNITEKASELQKREAKLVEDSERLLKYPPTKILDPSLKKARDDALDTIRKNRVEIEELRVKASSAEDARSTAEKIADERERELNMMINTNNEIKQGYVNTLNQITELHKTELEQRNSRIRELETLLMSALREHANTNKASTSPPL